MKKPIRALKSSGPTSPAGQARGNLYSRCLGRISAAVADGYVLEAITLLESLMADRLEARMASIHQQDPEKRKFSTLGRLVQELTGRKSAESEEAKRIYREVEKWSDGRNKAIHEFAKLQEGSTRTWETKYEEARQTAADGEKLFRDLNRIVTKLNRHKDVS